MRPRLIDTHCHLAGAAYEADRAEVLARAWEAGVGHVIVIGETPDAADHALALAASNPRLSATAGVHPHDARTWNSNTEAWLRERAQHPQLVAVGEIGLDYHYDHSPRPDQWRAFEAQLALARDVRKPAVIHAREADDDVATMLRTAQDVTVILHSFSSGLGLLRAGLSLRRPAYVSFSGMVTFKNWTLDDAIRETPLDRLLLETDGPFLAPVPHRGSRNEPGHVRFVAERVAAVRGIPVDELVAAVADNAARVFGDTVHPSRSYES